MLQLASPINRLLRHFPRTESAAPVKKRNAEWCAEGFACWTRCVSMPLCQPGRADSLREICNGLACRLRRRWDD